MRMTLIDERRYDEIMDGTVLPALANCCEEGWMEPAARPGLPELEHPGRLHYLCYDVTRFVDPEADDDAIAPNQGNGIDAPEKDSDTTVSGTGHDGTTQAADTGENAAPTRRRGTIVLSHGFTEFAAKYSEMIWYFLKAGYSVCAFEHRGHGKSPHDADDPNVVWIDDWRRYVLDLVRFAGTVGKRYAQGGPLYLYAHSMGGGVGAAALEQYPSLFDKAVLSSPMIAPVTAGIPNAIAGAAAETMCALGAGEKPVIGQTPFAERLDMRPYREACENRVLWYHKLRRMDRDYQANMPCYAWVREAIRLSHAVQRPQSCAHVRTPVLLCQSGHDVWVRNRPQEVFARRVRDGGGSVTIERFPESLHEIFSMPNTTLERYVDCVLEFLDS